MEHKSIINNNKKHEMVMFVNEDYPNVTNCVICLDDMEGLYYNIECGHGQYFHKKCILKFWKIQFICPMCRHEYPKNINPSISKNQSNSQYPTSETIPISSHHIKQSLTDTTFSTQYFDECSLTGCSLTECSLNECSFSY